MAVVCASALGWKLFPRCVSSLLVWRSHGSGHIGRFPSNATGMFLWTCMNFKTQFYAPCEGEIKAQVCPFAAWNLLFWNRWSVLMWRELGPLIWFCTHCSFFSFAFFLLLLLDLPLPPVLTLLLSPLIHLTPTLTLHYVVIRKRRRADEPPLRQRRSDCHWSAVFDFPVCCSESHTLNSCSFHFLPACPLWLKIASRLASTPSAANIWNVPRPQSGGLPGCYLLK